MTIPSSHTLPVSIIDRSNARAMIGDPRSAIVQATDAHLPSLSSKHLTKEFILNALNRVEQVSPATLGDGNRFAGRSIRDAAVLVALIERADGFNVLFTERASHLRDHAGQISFPGGSCDASDQDAWHTARREAWEEVGISEHLLTPIGRLHTYTTVTAFAVAPYVAWLAHDVQFNVNSEEVSNVFEVPLSFLMNPAHHQSRVVNTAVGERGFYSIPYQDEHGKEHFIWGATAGMIRNLHRVLAFDLK